MNDVVRFGASNVSTDFDEIGGVTWVKNNNSPVECSTRQIIGVVLILLFFASLASNSTLIFVFVKYDRLGQSMNTFLVAHAVLNLIGTVFELPFVIASHLMCR